MKLFDRLFGRAATQQDNEDPPANFPYPLSRVSGNDVVEQCLAWREEGRGSFTPVILGRTKDCGLTVDNLSQREDSPRDVVQRSAAIHAEKWFEEQLKGLESLTELTKPSAWNTTGGSSNHFQTPRDILSGKVHPWVWVAKIPTAVPYEVPAFLSWGGWNACPSPEEHVAVWRHWQNKYGAEILCITGDVIEATVARPPTEKEQCYRLASEQLSYCEDIVTQGVGSIDALAATVRGSRNWYFWWD